MSETSSESPPGSSRERRAAVRRQATLPFQWREVEDCVSEARACEVLQVPAVLALQGRLADLDAELQRACAALSDPTIASALRALEGKVAVLEQAVLGQAPVPELQPATLSADGIGFTASRALAPGTWLALHLVLPPSDHVLCRAQVTRCRTARAGGHQIGAEFRELSASVARRLTRFAIGRGRDEPKP